VQSRIEELADCRIIAPDFNYDPDRTGQKGKDESSYIIYEWFRFALKQCGGFDDTALEGYGIIKYDESRDYGGYRLIVDIGDGTEEDFERIINSEAPQAKQSSEETKECEDSEEDSEDEVESAVNNASDVIGVKWNGDTKSYEVIHKDEDDETEDNDAESTESEYDDSEESTDHEGYKQPIDTIDVVYEEIHDCLNSKYLAIEDSAVIGAYFREALIRHKCKPEEFPNTYSFTAVCGVIEKTMNLLGMRYGQFSFRLRRWNKLMLLRACDMWAYLYSSGLIKDGIYHLTADHYNSFARGNMIPILATFVVENMTDDYDDQDYCPEISQVFVNMLHFIGDRGIIEELLANIAYPYIFDPDQYEPGYLPAVSQDRDRWTYALRFVSTFISECVQNIWGIDSPTYHIFKEVFIKTSIANHPTVG
jgi:hypothetical protein